LPPFEIVELMSDAGVSCDVALVWAPPRDAFTRCPNLRGIIIRGQGVDHMMRDDTVPRDIPLIGMSLWAARRIVVSQQDFAFPRYTDSSGCNANSASGAINRWLKPRFLTAVLFTASATASETGSVVLNALQTSLTLSGVGPPQAWVKNMEVATASRPKPDGWKGSWFVKSCMLI
jgi:hypothetical protein